MALVALLWKRTLVCGMILAGLWRLAWAEATAPVSAETHREPTVRSASSLTPPAAPAAAPKTAPTSLPSPPLVDLNRASRSELLSVPGIGPKTADAILAYRLRRPFQRVSDLRRVRGVGAKRFRALQEYLTVSTPTPATAP